MGEGKPAGTDLVECTSGFGPGLSQILKTGLCIAALVAALAGCAQPSATPPPSKGSALLEPLERTKQAVKGVEAQQLERQKAVFKAPQ